MKKTISLLIAGILMSSVMIGCAGNKEEGNGATGTTTEGKPDADKMGGETKPDADKMGGETKPDADKMEGETKPGADKMGGSTGAPKTDEGAPTPAPAPAPSTGGK